MLLLLERQLLVLVTVSFNCNFLLADVVISGCSVIALRLTRLDNASKRVKRYRLTVCLHLGHGSPRIVLFANATALGSSLLDTRAVGRFRYRSFSSGGSGHDQ